MQELKSQINTCSAEFRVNADAMRTRVSELRAKADEAMHQDVGAAPVYCMSSAL